MSETDADSAKKKYPNHLIKEIFDQPQVLAACMTDRLDLAKKQILFPELKGFPVPGAIRIVGCGSSANAGMWGANMFEAISEIPVLIDVASEARFQSPTFLPNEVVLAISQSGESADTLSVIRDCKKAGLKVIVLTNTPGSTLAKLADVLLFTDAGEEIAIPATKSFSAQMIYLLLLAIYWAEEKGVLPTASRDFFFEELPELPENVALTLPTIQSTSRALAAKYRKFRHFFFLGRGINYPLALEGALKFKEITYIHAEGISLGAIPHGARALLDESVPIFALALSDQYLARTIQDLMELKKQGCKMIALCNPGQTPGVDDLWPLPLMYGPLSSFLALPAMQLFAYEIGIALNRTVDTPRTLTKAVTEHD